VVWNAFDRVNLFCWVGCLTLLSFLWLHYVVVFGIGQWRLLVVYLGGDGY